MSKFQCLVVFIAICIKAEKQELWSKACWDHICRHIEQSFSLIDIAKTFVQSRQSANLIAARDNLF